MKVAVLINGSANNGNALIKWEKVKAKAKALLPAETLFMHINEKVDFRSKISELVEDQGIRNFVSAGGDGSIHFLANALQEIRGCQLSEFCLGAIGLGSSNDFLKPSNRNIRGVPVRIDFQNKMPIDIGKVEITNGKMLTKKIFVVNASIGFTAEANRNFNSGESHLKNYLNKRHTNLAILYSVLKTLSTYENLHVEIETGETRFKSAMTNIGVAKNPHISGSFTYDLSTPPDSGEFGIYLAENLNRKQIVGLLYQLSKKRFSSYRGCTVRFAQSLTVKSPQTIALETDGEISEGQTFRFSVLNKSLYIAN